MRTLPNKATLVLAAVLVLAFASLLLLVRPAPAAHADASAGSSDPAREAPPHSVMTLHAASAAPTTRFWALATDEGRATLRWRSAPDPGAA